MSKKSIPKGVFMLGFVSMFMDVSSEMIHSLLPVFMTGVLGVSALAVGVVEGIAESTASILKIFSGAFSDWIGKRKPLLLLGYGLATLTRPLFPLANSIEAVLLARFTDRIGKGIRVAPRDALMADITPPEVRGAAYGLRQSLDTVGSIAGPLIAMILMLATFDNFRFVFTAAIFPAVIVIILIVFGVKEPEIPRLEEKRGFPLKKEQLSKLPPLFWMIAALGSVLMLARFSDAFLILRAHESGVRAAYLPIVLMVMNVIYMLVSWPAGILADRFGKKNVFLCGILALVMADFVLAHANTVDVVLAGAWIWGLHMGLTQGVVTAMIADQAPSHLRATAFGIYDFMTGIALFFASLIAGFLWKDFGPHFTFQAGAVFAVIALIGFLLMPGKRKG